MENRVNGLAGSEKTGSLTVRDAKPEDFPAIASIYAWHVEHGTGSFETVPPDEKELLQRWRKVLDWGSSWLVAENEDGRIMGYAYAGPYNTREAYRKTVEDSVYICRHAMHRGVGTALMKALIAACREKGFTNMVSVIGDSENRGSIGLHEKLGFQRCGSFTNVGSKFDRLLDVVFMQLPL